MATTQTIALPMTNEEIIKALKKKVWALEKDKLVFVARGGWPVGFIRGKRITNFLRILIHARKVMRYEKWLKEGGFEIDFT